MVAPRQQANPTSYYNSDRTGQGGQNPYQNSARNSPSTGYANRATPRSHSPSAGNYGTNAKRYQPNSAYSNTYNPAYYNQRGRGSWNQGSFPVENFQTYTSPFGYRRRGGGVEFHKGLDLAAPKGSYIRSWWTGRVTKVSDGGLCGTSITIQSGAWEHVYCHMIGRVEVIQGRRYLSDRDGGILIPQGQAIVTGSRIGRVGMTGRTTGPHLHWGIKYGKDWIDPALVLRAMYQQQAKNQ
ncbi:MAG: M23 family metallopeptidase [Oscillatoriales cyanobacterium]|nr:MAG: M23 family metallopeptidase [Oscillatoriales cyanobacterium]